MRPKYFLPWWPSDYVWKEWTPEHDLTREKHWSKAYLWDYMPGILDGILVSRMAVSPKKVGRLRECIRFHGVIIGDSGAHSYREQDTPPYSCEHLLEYYEEGRFDYGMTLDMVASPWVRKGGLNASELESRLEVTIRNAERCLNLHVVRGYRHGLVGVVQGWDYDSYRRCAGALLAMGFDYLAIAGQKKVVLVRQAIHAVKQEVEQAQRPIRIHVLGTGNPILLGHYREQGIHSFDSATWLRKAWLSENHNYFLAGADGYRAIRATRIGLGFYDEAELVWNGEVDCHCPLCRTFGQEILLFRGHERNTRRGFHNIYQYRHYLNSVCF